MKPTPMECRRCRQWQDETLQEAKQHADAGDAPVFSRCRIHGCIVKMQVEQCPDYQVSEDLFSLCRTCGIPVPKVCLSLGECLNCTDTDFYCAAQCTGKEERIFCTHYQRLLQNGYTMVEDGRTFEIFPHSEGPHASSEPTAVLQLLDDSAEEPKDN